MSVEKPAAEGGYFVPTLNKMGYATTQLDPYSQAFVDACCEGKKVLEIGAAYGLASLAALKKGAYVVANDIGAEHLSILESECPAHLRTKLELNSKAFPNDLSFRENSFDAILCCRVIHFFDPTKVEEAFKKFAEWLKVGGRLYLICESPYLKNFSQFIPSYEKRKREGELYPGFLVIDSTTNQRAKNLPSQVHWFDPDVLKRLAKNSKMLPLDCNFFPREQFPDDIRYDGRESVFLIAEKI